MIAVFALAMIAGHNLLDGTKAESFGAAKWLWMILHKPGFLQPTEGVTIFALYPLIPWISVMAAGYVFGAIMLKEAKKRRKDWWPSYL